MARSVTDELNHLETLRVENRLLREKLRRLVEVARRAHQLLAINFGHTDVALSLAHELKEVKGL